jgi:signal transduction histidine kinase
MTNEDKSIVTIEEDITTTDGFKAVILDVMSGNSGLEVVEYNDSAYYISYEPISLPGYSDTWSVITLKDRGIAMGVITRLVTQELLVVAVILILFVVLVTAFFRSLSKTLNYLENAKMEADNANRIKSSFLATMSHEIRTPLNAIIGLAQVELQQKRLPQESFEAMEMIYTSGNSLLKIINDILDLSKVETGVLDLTLEVYDTPSLINDTVQLNIVRIGDKNIDFILNVDESLPGRIRGDSLRVKQILNNLISNAIKYTNEGFVKLTVSHTPEEDNVILCFQVEDSGVGVTYEDQQRLFLEYTRFNTKDSHFTEGTGLGLTITKRLTELMNGSITVRSVSGKGSVFTVTIVQEAVECEPIGADVAKRLQSFEYVDASHALSQINYADLPNGSVLVVDDVDINLFVAEAVLAPYNLSVELLTSGTAAIERIESGKRYDIIFMDHMMPEMDGIEATERMRELGYTGAIIALTANALVGNEEMFTQHGFDGFIPKPIDIHDLDEIICKYIYRKSNI